MDFRHRVLEEREREAGLDPAPCLETERRARNFRIAVLRQNKPWMIAVVDRHLGPRVDERL